MFLYSVQRALNLQRPLRALTWFGDVPNLSTRHRCSSTVPPIATNHEPRKVTMIVSAYLYCIATSSIVDNSHTTRLIAVF